MRLVKKQWYSELYVLVGEIDFSMRKRVVSEVPWCYSFLTDKKRAWNMFDGNIMNLQSKFIHWEMYIYLSFNRGLSG